MRIEICIAKEKMTKMPTGAVDALKEELDLPRYFQTSVIT